MFALILTVCATAAMDDCQVYRPSSFPTEQQCQAMVGIQRGILGAENNYRVECVNDEEGDHQPSPRLQRGSEAQTVPA